MKNKNKIYENLVQVYYADLYRYAVWLTNNKAISEDILQETFLKAWNKLESLEDINKAKSIATKMKNAFAEHSIKSNFYISKINANGAIIIN